MSERNSNVGGNKTGGSTGNCSLPAHRKGKEDILVWLIRKKVSHDVIAFFLPLLGLVLYLLTSSFFEMPKPTKEYMYGFLLADLATVSILAIITRLLEKHVGRKRDKYGVLEESEGDFYSKLSNEIAVNDISRLAAFLYISISTVLIFGFGFVIWVGAYSLPLFIKV